MAIIEMPKDATGRWIPLDTKVLYNDRGVEYEVNRFTFGFDVITREGEWTAESYGTGDMVYRLPVNSMHLEKPDSLKQLMEDLNRVRDAHDERGKKSDDVRREVAAKMLEIIHENPDVSLQGMVASAMNECLPEGMEYGPTLAELIDRPTCHNVADYTKESFRCSECGCRVLVPGDRPDGVLVVTSEAFPVDWYSCPVCGAVVGE